MSHVARDWSHEEQTDHLIGQSFRLYVQRTAEIPTPVFIGLLTLLIAGVSAYDVYLTIAYAESLCDLEMNPVARAFMDLDGYGTFNRERLALFIGLKCAGTAFVVVTIFLLSTFRKQWGLAVASGVAAFQFLLLGFLSFG